MTTAPTDRDAWRALKEHHAAAFGEPRDYTMRAFFESDPGRAERMTFSACNLRVDFSKHLATEETLRRLVALAEACDVRGQFERMCTGERLNVTEGRAVLHVALRNRTNTPIRVDGKNVMPQVSACLAKMRKLVERVRSGDHVGHTGERITDIVNIGIGGSDLGPRMVCEALRPYWKKGVRVHFVSNVDGAHLTQTLEPLDASRTLFVVASKSFTTTETLTNASSARAWLVGELGSERAVGAHFVAVSTNRDAVEGFGIDAANCFEMWDWVGGRYSLWSAIGLPIALVVGMDAFEELLAGAHAMDLHMRETDLAENIPVLSAMLGIWYANFFGDETYAVLPYDQRLAELPAWLQQGDMESNGKRTRSDGGVVDGYSTGPIVWGAPGTNAQHSFFQLLHQGTRRVPCDFLAAVRPHYRLADHHDKLLANMLAQAEAMMVGRTEPEVRAELQESGMDAEAIEALVHHKVFEGDRPSTTILFDSLDPTTLGALLAMYEHRIFVQGVIWGVNSFDQFGVQLGKELAATLLTDLRAAASPAAHDSSTSAALAHIRSRREK